MPTADSRVVDGVTISRWDVELRPTVLRRTNKLSEELAELMKVLSRINLQGLDGKDPKNGRSNLDELEKEIADVAAQLQIIVKAFNLNRGYIFDRIEKKKREMEAWEEMCKLVE